MTKDQRKELIDLITDFRVGNIPRFAPLVLIKHYLRQFGMDKKIISRFTNSIPLEMGLMAKV